MASYIASIHYLALAFGFSGLALRQYFFKQPQKAPSISTLFVADNLWGLAALLWISTGLYRAFGGLEKGTEYYLNNGWFHIKLSLFLVVFLLEVYPMITFIKWRVQKKTHILDSDLGIIKRFSIINRLEIAIVIVLVFVASKMARSLF